MSDPVEEHIQAYNRRDLDRFVACFSPDCVMEDARGTILISGHAELRLGFERLFDENPGLGRPDGEQRGVVVSHVSNGVIDHQRVIR